MVNGLNPLMTVQACANSCTFGNLYCRLNKIVLRLRNENVSRLVLEGRSTNELNSIDSTSIRRKLFCSRIIQKTNSISFVSSLSSSLLS